MTDLALAYYPALGAADLCIDSGDLVIDDGLKSLVLASLLTDARAASREVSALEKDRRGWWGDALEERGVWGGKLWLLSREKTTNEVLRRAEDYARGSLAWMISEGIAGAIRVAASRIDGVGSGSVMTLGIEIDRPGGERVSLLYDQLWRAVA